MLYLAIHAVSLVKQYKEQTKHDQEECFTIDYSILLSHTATLGVMKIHYQDSQ